MDYVWQRKIFIMSRFVNISYYRAMIYYIVCNNVPTFFNIKVKVVSTFFPILFPIIRGYLES